MIYMIDNNHCILCYSFFFNLIISYQHQLFLVDKKKLISNHIFVLSLFLSHLCSYEYTGCSLNIVFFPKILKYSRHSVFPRFSRCQCVYTHQAGRIPALQQNWQSSENSKNFKEKHNI